MNTSMNVAGDAVAVTPKYRIRVSAISLRWLLLLLFPIGFAISDSAYWSRPEYFIMNVLCMAAFGLLLSNLKKPIQVALPVWIMLLVFLDGYFTKFYWMTWVIANDQIWLFDPRIEAASRDSQVMMDLFRLMTACFCSFCVCASLCMKLPLRASYHSIKTFSSDSPATLKCVNRFCIVGLWSLGVFMFVTAIAQALTGVGVMGSEAVVLQNRMAGFIVHPRNISVPLLLLLIAWLSDMYGLKKIFMAATIMLIFHGLSQSFLMASRGMLINMTLPLFMLWILQKRMSRQRMKIIIGLLIATAVLHPIITGLRYARSGGADLSVETMQEARTIVAASDSSGGFLVAGFTQLINRVCGTDVLLTTADWPVPDVPTLENIRYFLQDSERSLPRVFTQDVAGFGRQVENHQIAPTLVGASYVIGGTITSMFAVGFWVIFWVIFRNWYLRFRLRSLAVIDATFMGFLLTLTSDFSVPDSVTIFMMMMIPTVIFAELAMKWYKIPLPIAQDGAK